MELPALNLIGEEQQHGAPPRRALLQCDSRDAKSAKAALPEMRSFRKAMICRCASSLVRVTVGSFQDEGLLTSLQHSLYLATGEYGSAGSVPAWRSGI